MASKRCPTSDRPCAIGKAAKRFPRRLRHFPIPEAEICLRECHLELRRQEADQFVQPPVWTIEIVSSSKCQFSTSHSSCVVQTLRYICWSSARIGRRRMQAWFSCSVSSASSPLAYYSYSSIGKCWRGERHVVHRRFCS